MSTARAAPLDLTNVRPFVSSVILEASLDDAERAFAVLTQALRRLASGSRDRRATIVADGIEPQDQSLAGPTTAGDGFDGLDGFVSLRTTTPRWFSREGPFVDNHHELTVSIRRRRLIAINCDAALRERLQKWLDREPRPPLRRVAPDVLQGALLRGEAKGLWLRGTETRRATRPDSKNISGLRLQDALNPLEDGSFAMGSARAAIPEDDTRSALVGTVGTTPREALVWHRASTDFDTFLLTIRELLDLIEQTLLDDAGVERPYPLLATTTAELVGVHGAYEIVVLAADELAHEASVELVEAADRLAGAHLDVRGEVSSANFDIDVGFASATSGTLRARVTSSAHRVDVEFRLKGEPSDPPTTATIRDALGFTELLAVYYESGHVLSAGAFGRREIRSAPFPNWEFADFTGFRVDREKPVPTAPQDLHDAIAAEDDDSLFAWIVRRFSKGWLTCDDGSGEVADFVHLARDGMISIVHAKGANSAADSRGVSVGAYELVASQASKNLACLNGQVLRDRLRTSPVTRPATWFDGRRTDDRGELLEMLDARSTRDRAQVVIVQPHVRRTKYEQIKTGLATGAAALRLNLLETLLNSARGSIVSMGGDLVVVASQ